MQISSGIHEDIWWHFPMHLDSLEKGTKNATIYAESESNFGYKQTIKFPIR